MSDPESRAVSMVKNLAVLMPNEGRTAKHIVHTRPLRQQKSISILLSPQMLDQETRKAIRALGYRPELPICFILQRLVFKLILPPACGLSCLGICR